MLEEKSRPTEESGNRKDCANIVKFSELVDVSSEIFKIDWEKTGEVLLTEKVQKLPCIIDPILPKCGLVALAGSSDGGKSSFLRDLAMHISAGEESFLGFPIHSEHQSVIYVSSEDDDNAVSYLLHRQNTSHHYGGADLRGLRFIFDTEDLLDKLTRSLSQKPADVVILDCFADFFRGQINTTNEVRDFLNDYSKLAKDFGCLVILLHHTRKGSENLNPSKNNVLGSQGFEAKMRLIMELRKDPQAVGTSYLCFTKGNYLPDYVKKNAIVLKFSTESLTYTSTGDTVPIDELAVEQQPKGKITEQYARLLKEKLDCGTSQNQACKDLGINPAYGTELKKRFPEIFS